MIKRYSISGPGFILMAAVLLLWAGCGSGKTPSEVPPFQVTDDTIQLAVLYPSTGSLTSLIELRSEGLLNIDNLLVTGYYHRDEKTDYKQSMDLVREQKINWIRFSELEGELTADNLFQINPLTPVFEKIFLESDGIIFFGGADIPPSIYGEKTRLLSSVTTTVRSYLETSLVFHLLGGSQNPSQPALLETDYDFPVLGICLGCQTINVGTGGSLVQDIPSEVYGLTSYDEVAALGREHWHTNPWARIHPEKNLLPYNLHPILLQNEGKFVQEMGMAASDTPTIMSAHHQMAGRLGKGLKVIATSLDGRVPEALEHERFPSVLGVQFHPEFSMLWNQERKFRIAPDDVEETTARAILEKTSSSMPFHQKIWAWFAESLYKSQLGK